MAVLTDARVFDGIRIIANAVGAQQMRASLAPR
jgi:hypothetical protein